MIRQAKNHVKGKPCKEFCCTTRAGGSCGSMKRGSSESERGQIKGWMETARRACEHAVALAPAVAQTHIFLGVINDTLGDLDESLRVYDRALEALPSDAAPEVLLFKAKVVSLCSPWFQALRE